MPQSERGVVLLEVLLALALFSIAGVVLLSVSSAAVRAEAVAREREAEAARLETVMSGLALLSRAELEQRVGTRRLGEFEVRISRNGRAEYRVIVVKGEVDLAGALVTVLYRPAGPGA